MMGYEEELSILLRKLWGIEASVVLVANEPFLELFLCFVLQGKQKYTLSIYRAMKSGSETAQALAVEIFAATAPQLHVHVQNYVKKILGLKTEGN